MRKTICFSVFANIWAILIYIISLTSFSYVTKNNASTAPQTLKGTSWTSQFYHYCNYYRFDTDSTGQSESGQVAWSLPVDTLALGISGDLILYSGPADFKYQITDTVLTIEYIDKNSDVAGQKDVFYYRPERNDWISKYAYSYGKECLEVGEKKEKFEYLDIK